MKSATRMSVAKQVLLNRYLQGAPAVDTKAIRPRPPGLVTPLSLAQEEVYRRDLRVGGDPPLYNECITVRMPGALEPAVLQRAFDEIVRRHEIWRTTFETRAGSPIQRVHPFRSVEVENVDLACVPQGGREDEAIGIIAEKIRRPFRLDRGPLLRPTLIRMSAVEHRLYLVAHQIILDGMSAYRIFPSELALLYQAFLNGRPSPLPDLPIQYADFACWQRESVIGLLPAQITHWRGLLGSTARPMRPARIPTVCQKDYQGRIESFVLTERTSNQVKQLRRALSTTEFLILLSGLAVVLHRSTGEASVRIGTLSPSGRKRTEVMGLLGYFLNPVTLTFDFSSAPSFSGVVQQARAAVTEAICNDDVPIEHLARELNCDHTPNPFCTVSTSLQPPQPDLPLPWQVTSMDVDSRGSPWKLYIAFIDAAATIIGRAQFNPGFFESGTVHELLRDLQSILDDAYSQCAAKRFTRS